jgi:predicted lipoprotein with Yx(FWY)xxD motif
VPATSTGTLKAPTGVTAALTSFARSDSSGTQVLLGGKALYTYSADTAPGDTKGEGVGNVWHVAKAA